MKIKNVIKQICNRLRLKVPLMVIKTRHYNHMKQIIRNCGYEPGHYFSPIPDLAEIERDADTIFGPKDLPEIDLNTENQIRLLEELKTYYPGYMYATESLDSQNFRYKKEGAYYRFSDSVFLYCMIRKFKPGKIIEVGSGHSSAIMLDTSEMFFNNSISFTFIEPSPEDRLLHILRESDKIAHEIMKEKLQSIKPEFFQKLTPNDILFIDTTHVSKIGSDVNYLVFEVLPALKPGVLIHFHDIIYPFELPQHWVFEHRRFWNESYLLHAFLMNNRNYEIVAFNSYLQKIKPDWFKKEMPECMIGSDDTGSLWLRKLA